MLHDNVLNYRAYRSSVKQIVFWRCMLANVMNPYSRHMQREVIVWSLRRNKKETEKKGDDSSVKSLIQLNVIGANITKKRKKKKVKGKEEAEKVYQDLKREKERENGEKAFAFLAVSLSNELSKQTDLLDKQNTMK